MIDFSTVSREFQGLVARRRELMTFLGSVFAAMGLFLQNALQGNMPDSLSGIERHLFAFYSVMLLVPSLVTALRMARLHGGMVLNGMLYARLMQDREFGPAGDPDRASRHNYFGVSFLYFLLADLLAGFAAALLALSLQFRIGAAAMIGVATVAAGLVFHFRTHRQAVAIARAKIRDDAPGTFVRDDWEDHLARSLEECNLGLIGDLAFVGLIMFSAFEVLSSLGRIDPAERTDLAPAIVETYGPLLYSGAVVLVCVIGLLTYLRVRVAIGVLSLQLDPSDRPFRPLRLTDSLLGYVLLAFLFAVALHVLLVQLVPGTEGGEAWLLATDAAVFGLVVLAEQLTLVVAGRALNRRTRTPEPAPVAATPVVAPGPAIVAAPESGGSKP